MQIEFFKCDYIPTFACYRRGSLPRNLSRYGGVLAGRHQLRRVFNDTDAEVLWLFTGAPEELEFLPGPKSRMDLSLIYPPSPEQLPKELAGVEWPLKYDMPRACGKRHRAHARAVHSLSRHSRTAPIPSGRCRAEIELPFWPYWVLEPSSSRLSWMRSR
jgi:hypothetical protein